MVNETVAYISSRSSKVDPLSKKMTAIRESSLVGKGIAIRIGTFPIQTPLGA